MNKPLWVLIVDDSEDDALLLVRELRRGGYDPCYLRVDTAEAMAAALQTQRWDAVLSDHAMPGFSSTAALALLQKKGLDLPFIIISAMIGEETAVAAMKAGAHDYLLKANLARLAPAVERELRDAEERRKRRRAEKELVDYDRLRHLEFLRDSLVHMVVHDMRTPLAAIMANLDLLKAILPDETNLDSRESIDIAYRNARCLNDMATELLHISRFEAGQMPLQKQQCNLVEVAQSAVKLHKHLSDGRSLEMKPAAPCEIVCDEDIVRRIFANLLGNALKFTPKGGKVSVEILPGDHFIRSTVSDTGPGIPASDHQAIFDKFGQIESRGQTVGVGLGLAFCKLAAEAHGGKIGLESEDGKGSCFWFTLPRDPKATEASSL